MSNIQVTAIEALHPEIVLAVPGVQGPPGPATSDYGTDPVTAGRFIPTSSTVPTNGVYLPAANSVGISTNGSGRLFVDASGNVSIGTTTPGGLLHVQSNLAGNNQLILTNIASSNSGAGSEIVFTQGASGFAAGKIQCDREGSYSATTASQDSALAFFTAADGVDSEKLRITSTGQVRLAGAGITFNGDTATANELDDYEEGTWVPTYTGSSSNPTIVYANQSGYYTKIGNIVFVYFILGTSSVSGGSGVLRVAGLPFAINADGDYPIYGNIVGEAIDWLSNTPTKMTVSPDSTGTSSIQINVETGLVAVSDMATGGVNKNRLRASLVYRAA